MMVLKCSEGDDSGVSVPCMRNNNVVEGRVALAEASETNLDHHVCVFDAQVVVAWR